MDVEIEKPHVHHRKSGIPWYDLALPIAALFVSLISIYIAWHHGQVMKELVHQNERLVEANSLPYLQIDTSNLDSDLRTRAFRLTVHNQGIGPARIAEMVVTIDGRPVPNFDSLVDRCCAPGLIEAAKKGAREYDGLHSGEVVLSTMRDRMIRPGESIDAFNWRVTPQNAVLVDRLQSAFSAGRILTRLCFCSVFEDCWTRTNRDRRPITVPECPVAQVPYRQ